MVQDGEDDPQMVQDGEDGASSAVADQGMSQDDPQMSRESVSTEEGSLSSATSTEADEQQDEEEGKNDLSLSVPDNPTQAHSATLRWRRIFLSPVQAFHCIREQRHQKVTETLSSSTRSLTLSSSSPSSPSLSVKLPLVGEVKWDDFRVSLRRWLTNPMNLALLLWVVAVAVSGAMLFLIMVGFLDHAIHSKSQRDTWFEINNQILNALFTIMCLYVHPRRLLHIFLLYRRNPDDIKQLREVYCKDGTTCKPHEWPCILLVVLLLNLNCFLQYTLCGLNLGYRKSDRPVLGVGLCIGLAVGAPAAAGIFTILSPLGRDS